MNCKRIVLFVLLFATLTSGCKRGNKNPGLSDEALFAQKDSIATQELYASDYVADSIPPGIKYRESRIQPQNPPARLNYTNRELSVKSFDLSDYHQQLRYVKLKHPLADSRFLFDARYYVSYDQGAMSGRGYHSKVLFADNYILVGDAFYGLHCYNKDGQFLYTIEENNYPKDYSEKENKVSYEEANFSGFKGTLSVNKNNCAYLSVSNNKYTFYCYNLDLKKVFITTSSYKGLFLKENSLLSFGYNPRDVDNPYFMYSFGLKGDTLCAFRNYNPRPDGTEKGNASIPGSDIYYYKGQICIRQILNDTIFRVSSEKSLTPAYILDFGTRKLDLKTLVSGDAVNKLIPYTWLEFDNYIMFVYTENRDTPNNRRDGIVKFFYSYYDKKSGKLVHLTDKNTLPEELLISNSLPDGLPFTQVQMGMENGKLMVCYNKRRLENLMKHSGFTSLPKEQQEKVKSVREILSEGEILVMILE